eukprot:1588896-Pyramimonas_sp.AAC.1
MHALRGASDQDDNMASKFYFILMLLTILPAIAFMGYKQPKRGGLSQPRGGIADLRAGNQEQGRLNRERCRDIRRRLNELVRAERRGGRPPNAVEREKAQKPSARARGDSPPRHGPKKPTGGNRESGPSGERRCITE